MIPFSIASFAVWMIADFFAKLRPRKSSAFLFYPIFVVIALASIVIYHISMSQSTDGYVALGSPVQSALGAAVVGSVVVWRAAKEHAQATARKRRAAAESAEAARLEEEAARLAVGDDPRLDSRPMAAMAIRHRPEVLDVWKKVSGMGSDWSLKFLEVLESDPKSDPVRVANSIGVQFNEVYPYSEQSTEDAYQSIAPYGASAAREFRATVFTLGETVDPAAVAQSIIAESSAHAKYPPGVYRIGKRRLRILPNGEVVLFLNENGEPSLDHKVYADLDALRAALSTPEATMRLEACPD